MNIEKERLLTRDTVNSLVVRVHGLNRLFVTTNRVLIPFTSCKNMTDQEKKKNLIIVRQILLGGS